MGVFICTDSPNPSIKPKDDKDWQLIGGLIGGSVLLLIILVGAMVATYRWRSPNNDINGMYISSYVCSNICFNKIYL